MDIRREVERAEERIRGLVVETPVERVDLVGEGEVHLKMEQLQLTRSFKLRGATNAIRALPDEVRERGVVAASSGNHGAAVALAAATARCPAVVFVPEGAAETKLAEIRYHGAELRRFGDDCVVAEAEARRFATAEGMTYVSPYNDPLVVAGQGTMGVELARQAPRLDALFVALGGGGLISGVGGYLKTVWPGLEVVACSPRSSPVMHASLEAGRIVEMESLPTLSDGTAGAVEPGAITFDLCRRVIDRSLLVSEEEIRAALELVVGRHGLAIEGAAAVAVAGYLAVGEGYRGAAVGIVLCGGNVDPALLRELAA